MRCGMWGAMLTLACVLCFPPPARAQGSRADYERAARPNREAQALGASLRIEPRWLEGGRVLWCQAIAPDGSRRWVRVETDNGRVSDFLDADTLAAAFRALGVGSPAGSPTIQRLEPDESGAWAILANSDQAWRITFSPLAVESRPVAEATPLLIGSTPARRPNRSTELLIANLGSQPVEAFWINPGGGAHSYGTIAPGATKRQHTYSGHEWRFSRADGTVMGRCEGAEEAAFMVLTDTPPSDSAPPQEARQGRPQDADDGNAARSRARLREGAIEIAPAGSRDFTRLDLFLAEGFRCAGPLHPSPDGRYVVAFALKPAPEHIVTFLYNQRGHHIRTPLLIDVESAVMRRSGCA
jgi:hypothetical protein